MRKIAVISFSLEPLTDYRPPVYAVMPKIDGTTLLDLIAIFERERHMDPAGGYGGIIPQFYNYGPLDRYLMGQTTSESAWADGGGVFVLGCDCGEVGCWPLVCRVKLQGETVVWDEFKQPYRPQWDYSQFGPFVFDAAQYQTAVQELQAQYTQQMPDFA
jgi:hypothetical protein